MHSSDLLGIGELSTRSGVSVATLRFYEEKGLIASTRTAGNQRRYRRHVLRRLGMIAAGRRVGLSLEQLAGQLATLPAERAPTQREWARLSRPWQDVVATRIEELERLRDSLDGCIGCGCLSLTRCRLFNPGDEAAAEGPGARAVRAARPPRPLRLPAAQSVSSDRRT